MSYPLVQVYDHGIRPAGPKDACFYCKSKVGTPHGKDCIVVTKVVRLKITVEVETREPFSWDKEQIEFRYNDGSWCASNVANMIEHRLNSADCLCGTTKVEFVDVVDNTPKVVKE